MKPPVSFAVNIAVFLFRNFTPIVYFFPHRSLHGLMLLVRHFCYPPSMTTHIADIFLRAELVLAANLEKHMLHETQAGEIKSGGHTGVILSSSLLNA